MVASIHVGARVYIKFAVCGDPGCVMSFDKKGRALVDWSSDMPEINRLTAHDPESLIVDEAFTVRQLDLSFDEMAA
jgi:hypothetical protein